jgi:Zn-dependent protease
LSPDITGFLLTAVIVAPGIILAITLHEASHGYVAWKLGDDTAYMLGRVTFNPLRHIDPLGTIILPALLVFTTGYMFGYAKPVPVNYRKQQRAHRLGLGHRTPAGSRDGHDHHGGHCRDFYVFHLFQCDHRHF